MRHFSVVAMLVAGLSVSGCIYVPPVWDIGDAINELGQIKERTTTKEEVLNLLGEPDWGHEKKRAVFCQGEWSDRYEVLPGWLGQRTGI
jgi:hypothetical protein